MKKFFLFAILFSVFLACTKYTTPRKVNRHISGTWKITSITFDGQSALETYVDYTFFFSEENGIVVKGPNNFKESGTWELGLVKNPAILYLNFTPVDGLEFLSDDWQVTEISKSNMSLKRNDSNSSSGYIKLKKN